MSDMDGEAAFLASMGGQPAYDPAYRQPQEEEDDDDYDPSSFMPDASNAPETGDSTPAPAVAAPQTPADSAPVSAATSQAPSRTASRMSNAAPAPAVQPPRQIGGFIEEDDEEEDDTVQTSQVAGTNGSLAVASTNSPAQTPARSVNQTPVQVQTQPAVMGASSVVPNGAASTFSPAPPSQTATPVGSNVADAAFTQPLQAPPQSNASLSNASVVPKARLPHDVVGQLEDRIQEDPKGDIEAWLSLIDHYRSKNKFDEARQVYDRFFKIFPTASDQWVAYATMENELSEMGRLERLFHASLMDNYSIALWSIYLGHVQRQHNLTMQPEKRPIVSQAWEFTLGQIGMDKDAGQLWQDYISFIKSAPGTIGGSGWQDAQKMDTLRKAYQRAISVPTQATTSLWKEYDNFEMGLNKMTGRKFLQEKSPSYMTARSSYTALQNITRDLNRTTLPSLPPVPGCGGEDEYLKQVEIWQKWIEWEKEDPLVLKDEDLAAYRNRVLFVYRQAVVSLRFWPQMWYDAADWCFENDLEKEGNEFLTKGVAANPESCLLAFRQADRIEQTMASEEGAEGAKKKGDAVKAPYDNLLTALYALIDKVKQREAPSIARIQEYFASLPPLSREPTPQPEEDDDEDEKTSEGPALNSREAEQNRQIEEVRKSTQVQIETLKKTLSFAWIALLRAMRRIQGKGKPEVDGMRNVFATARKKGRLTSDVYVATALLEHHCYKDPAATKIFERGMKLFPEDEHFALAYLKHLIDINDVTNARAVFETTVSKLTTKPENIPRTRTLFLYFHEYESQYGELAQITKLERRMAELFPSDPSLARFAHRFAAPHFDPCATRLVLSPTQIRPRTATETIQPTMETLPLQQNALQTGYVPSPKRPLDTDSDAEGPARKFIRAESPLKGAAGRRQQQRRMAADGTEYQRPKPLARPIWDLLHQIPNARLYLSQGLPTVPPQAALAFLKALDVSRARRF